VIGNRDYKFKEGEIVYTKDYKNPNKTIWEKETVLKVLGDRIYLIKCNDETVKKRHLDQIITNESNLINNGISGQSKENNDSILSNNECELESNDLPSHPIDIVNCNLRPKRFTKQLVKLNL